MTLNNMHPRRVFGFTNDGKVLIDNGSEGIETRELEMLHGGALRVAGKKEVPIDQKGERHRPTRAERMRGIDQL